MTQLGGHPSSVLQKLQEQRELEEFCDVVLKVETTEFPAHRSVLAACSDYFHKMFMTDMIEKSNKFVVIYEISANTMKNILTCIYTGKIELRLYNIVDVLHAASLMQLNQILDEVTWHINYKLLNAETACFFRDLALRYSLKKLESYVYQVFLSQFQEVSIHPDFLSLDIDAIKNIICSDDLVVKEERQVFEFLINWVQKDVEERKQQFLELFKLVRLQFIPIKYVVDKIQKNVLVRESHVCRDAVDEMMSYHISPSVIKTQKPRNSLVPKPDSAMLLPFRQMFQCIYNLESFRSFNAIFDGLTCDTIFEETAIATKYPVSVFCGGKTELNESTQKAVRFDGVRWMELPPMNEPRCGATAVFFGDDLLIFGGEKHPISTKATFSQGQTNPDACNFSTTYEKFNTEWTFFENIIFPRSHFAAVVVNGKIYLIGGYMLTDSDNPDPASHYSSTRRNLNYLCKYPCKETLIFTPANNCLEKSGNLHAARTSFASAVLNSTIYVVGGVGKNDNNVNSVESLKATENMWTSIIVSESLGICTAIPSATNKLWIFSQHQQTLYYYENQSKQLNNFEKIGNKGVIIPFSLKYHTHPYIHVYKLTEEEAISNSHTSSGFTFRPPSSLFGR